jgi:GAF domain-containing protein
MVGLRGRQMPRVTTFCNVTIQSEDGFIVPDALQHPFFNTIPFVIGPPHIRSYAGQPLRGPGGWVVGSLCVMDTRPQEFTHADRRSLRRLADCAELEINGGLSGQVPQ